MFRALARLFVRQPGHSEAIVGPGGKKSGELPTNLDQLTGVERLEYIAELKGKHAFNINQFSSAIKGNWERPIKVPSVLESRIVGCAGWPPGEHDIIWFHIKEGKKQRCYDCGQAFELQVLTGNESEADFLNQYANVQSKNESR